MTDENGLYDHFIKHAFKQIHGNILLVILDDIDDDDDDDDKNNSEMVEIQSPNKENINCIKIENRPKAKEQQQQTDNSTTTLGEEKASSEIGGVTPTKDPGERVNTFEDTDERLGSEENVQKPSNRNHISNRNVKYASKSLYESHLYDTNQINTIVKEGRQPFMDLLSKQFRVIVIKNDYNYFQNEYITNYLHRCLYKAPIHNEYHKYGIYDKKFDKNFKAFK